MFIVKVVKSFSQFGWENGNFFSFFPIRKFVAAANLLKNILFIIHWMTYRIIFKRTFHSSFTQFCSPLFSLHTTTKVGEKSCFSFFDFQHKKIIIYIALYPVFHAKDEISTSIINKRRVVIYLVMSCWKTVQVSTSLALDFFIGGGGGGVKRSL